MLWLQGAKHKLIIRVIKFQISATYTPTVHQRYRRTDERPTIAIPRFALCASRGKNVIRLTEMLHLCRKSQTPSALVTLDIRPEIDNL